MYYHLILTNKQLEGIKATGKVKNKTKCCYFAGRIKETKDIKGIEVLLKEVQHKLLEPIIT